MREKFIDHLRLFDKLKIEGQKRQIVFCGGEDDLFLTVPGEQPVEIEEALKRYLVENNYHIIITMNRSIYSTRINVICPNAKDSTINDVNFKEEQEDELYQSLKDCIEKTNPQARIAIIFLYPDTMLLSANPLQEHMKKLQVISSFARIKNCASFLILDENRSEKFNELLDWVLNNNEYSSSYVIDKPKTEIFEAFLKDEIEKHSYMCKEPHSIAATAAAEGSSLKNFSARMNNFLKNAVEDHVSLDNMYLDEEKVKSLDEIKQKLFSLTGLADVKQYAQDLIDRVNASKEKINDDFPTNCIRLPHFLFIGNPGTGKTLVARLLGQLFLNLGLRTRNAFVEISFGEMGTWDGEIRENMLKKIREAAGGVLFVDEVYNFTENESGKQALQILMKAMEEQRDSLTVIMAGYKENVPELFKVNPGFESRIGRILNFPDYTEQELCSMIQNIFDNEKILCPDEVMQIIQEYIHSFLNRGGIGNGRGIRKLSETILAKFTKRKCSDRILAVQDVPEPMKFHQEEAAQFLKDIEKNFIGIPRVKAMLHSLYRKCIAENLRSSKNVFLQPNNCFFLGNPGTGKTTIARRMGEFFYLLGLVSEKNKIVEVDAMNDLTSCYYGEYAKKVKDKFEEAVGGVLFIDEAYQLAKDNQGLQIIDQMVKLMTDPRYLNMVVIFAGYPDEMQNLYKANPGLKRRCPYEFWFDDFCLSDLKKIFHHQMNLSGLSVGGDPNIFNAHLSSILGRMAARRHFGNAGTVINYFRNTVLGRQAERIQQDVAASPAELLYADLLEETQVYHRSLAEIFEALDHDFVGMVSLKSAIKRIASRIRMQQLRTKNVTEQSSVPCYNMRFTGNPGTGKTSMARCMADVFCSLGIISRPQVKEYRGVDLKGSYVGQTKDKINKIFEDSADSIVFIDEIYSLFPDKKNNQDSFGLEAIDTLVGCMTDPKNATTIIIIAGYQKQMEDFLSANPGLASRFPLEIQFPDYTDEECFEILLRLIERNGYTIRSGDKKLFKKYIMEKLNSERKMMRENFGNARTIKKIFDQIIDSMSERIVSIATEDLNDEILNTIEPSLDLASS